MRANQYARWGLSQGVKPGETVALFMANHVEYVAMWLGLTRIGATVALINTQLSGAALAHCLQVAAPRMTLVGAELAPVLAAVRGRAMGANCWVLGSSGEDLAKLDPVLAQLPGDLLRAGEYTAPTLDSTALYIYTSGTTGLPKAAHVSHYRLMRWSQWFAGLMDTRPEDRHVRLSAALSQRGRAWWRSVRCSSAGDPW